jgi:glutathione S-transferase
MVSGTSFAYPNVIDLYGCGSPNVFKVLLMLAETELPHCMHEVGVHRAEQFTPAFRGLNPNSKVPVIVDREGPADVGRRYDAVSRRTRLD